MGQSGPVTAHTVGQQHASVSQQGSPAETKPVVRRIVNSEPIIFDLRQGDDELEDQGVRVIHFYIGDDDDDVAEFQEIDISDDEPMVRRLGEEHEDVAIIIDSGADVAFFSLSVADRGEGELQDAAKSVEISSHDLDGREVL